MFFLQHDESDVVLPHKSLLPLVILLLLSFIMLFETLLPLTILSLLLSLFSSSMLGEHIGTSPSTLQCLSLPPPFRFRSSFLLVLFSMLSFSRPMHAGKSPSTCLSFCLPPPFLVQLSLSCVFQRESGLQFQRESFALAGNPKRVSKKRDGHSYMKNFTCEWRCDNKTGRVGTEAWRYSDALVPPVYEEARTPGDTDALDGHVNDPWCCLIHWPKSPMPSARLPWVSVAFLANKLAIICPCPPPRSVPPPR